MGSGSGTLLGRDREVKQAVQVITGEVGGIVAVLGPAGIGKSAVIEAVAQEASRTGISVRSSTGAPSESGLPFVALRDLLGHDLAEGYVNLPRALHDALDGALFRSRDAGTANDPLTLHLATLEVIEQLCADRRLLIVLDDLPWIDPATRASLAFVLRRVPTDRLSLLVSMRPDSHGTDLASPATTRTVHLEPLDIVALAGVVELRAGIRLSHRQARQVHQQSGGNPLLALELVRTATLDQDALADLSVPERHRAVLSPRIRGLSEDGRRAALAAALLSRPTLEELADVVTLDGVLETEGAGVSRIVDGRIEFTHPMFASLCRELAGTPASRDMHARLAKAAHDPIERARHLGNATLLPDEDVAAQLQDAAERARDRAAIAEAAELSLTAARLTPADDEGRRSVRTCLAAELFYETGDIDTAEAVLNHLLANLAPGPSRARALAVLADVTGEDSDAAADHYDEALRQPGLDPDFEDELRFRRTGMLVNLGDLPGSADGVAELEQRARAAGNLELARACCGHLAYVDLMTGTPVAESAAWKRMVEDIAECELSYDHPDLMRAWDKLSREQNEESAALIRGLMQQADRVGNLGLWASLAMHLGETELRRGDIRTSRDLSDQVRRIMADGRHDEGWLVIGSVAVTWEGQLEAARADATEALRLSEAHHNRLFGVVAEHVLGFADLSEGKMVGAAAHYDRVAVGMHAMGWRHPSLVVWHGNAVEALLGAGRRADAIVLTGELDDLAERLDLDTSRALALRCRALVHEDAGDLDEAAALLDESLALSQSLDNPLEHARTLLIRGIVQRRRRQKARSRADLTSAHDIFASRGATMWAARAQSELERSAAITAGRELTGSERAVAELAASGATNREIATELYLSEKTVEAVLTRVYRKLAVRSRAQLARHSKLAHAVDGRS